MIFSFPIYKLPTYLFSGRAARHAQPTYQALCETVRGSPVVTPDETSWKGGGHHHWLWAFATPATTVYAIQDGRGFAQAATGLGADYAGVLQRDGWAPYRPFVHAGHQTCLAHLLRRCRTMILDHPPHPLAPQVNVARRARAAAAVITRKTCGGGNRTARGAQTQQVLASVLRTAQQRGRDTTDLVTTLLRAPRPVLDVFHAAPVH